MLAGIACGGIKRLEDGTEEAAPFAREARYFVESRLLNRDVDVKLEGVDKNGTLLGTALHTQVHRDWCCARGREGVGRERERRRSAVGCADRNVRFRCRAT